MYDRDCFHWDLPGLNATRFASLTNLLSLRNGGQLEPAGPSVVQPSSHTDVLEVEDDDIDSLTDLNVEGEIPAASVPPKSSPNHIRLMEKFLDRLAELVSREKGGDRVACTAMRAGDHEVHLWVSLNDSFTPQDRNFLKRLEEDLTRIASQQSRDNTRT
jgi:hypothetical protein